MPGAGGVLVVALTIGIGGGLLLYAMVRQEHAARQETDRDSGEQMARRDAEETTD